MEDTAFGKILEARALAQEAVRLRKELFTKQMELIEQGHEVHPDYLDVPEKFNRNYFPVDFFDDEPAFFPVDFFGPKSVDEWHNGPVQHYHYYQVEEDDEEQKPKLPKMREDGAIVDDTGLVVTKNYVMVAGGRR